MRTWLVLAFLSGGTLSGWAWLQARGSVRELTIPALEVAERSPDSVASITLEWTRVSEPIPSEAISQGPAWPVAAQPAAVVQRLVATAEAERVARRFFHAQVNVEELERALPADVELNPRTPERFPGFFAAIAEREQLGVQLTQVPPPQAREVLPALDLHAKGSCFERIYGNWPREDLLVENWRISRAAYAESSRVLDDRLTNGPYDTKPVGQLFAMG